MEDLAVDGEFSRPEISTLESALAYGLGLHRGRVFMDLWDMPAAARLAEMNLRQTIL
jgi:hypothetical protein